MCADASHVSECTRRGRLLSLLDWYPNLFGLPVVHPFQAAATAQRCRKTERERERRGATAINETAPNASAEVSGGCACSAVALRERNSELAAVLDDDGHHRPVTGPRREALDLLHHVEAVDDCARTSAPRQQATPSVRRKAQEEQRSPFPSAAQEAWIAQLDHPSPSPKTTWRPSSHLRQASRSSGSSELVACRAGAVPRWPGRRSRRGHGRDEELRAVCVGSCARGGGPRAKVMQAARRTGWQQHGLQHGQMAAAWAHAQPATWVARETTHRRWPWRASRAPCA